jgi:hypothetical protein
MPWKIVERKIGKAGGVKRLTARQREWDPQYGDYSGKCHSLLASQ